ncbi:MAG: LD-carboxypeptidase [Pelomonas sp.]|nr:LD-carboxypeptidase [Roseateles sp.]
MTPSRRQLLHLGAGAAGLMAAASPTHASSASPSAPAPVLAPRLRPGDTLGLVSPANATFEREPLKMAIESLQALGFKVKPGEFVSARRGPFAGTDAQRAADVNAMFADDSVAGVIAMTGGSGCNRIVDRLDYGLIRRRPKFFGGFSDLTSLVNAIQRQTGLVTFHSPVAASEWNDFSVQSFRALVMNAEAAVLRNPVVKPSDDLIVREERISTLRGGKAQGRLVGGNLTVLASLAGTPYFPDCRGALLFLEDINEYIYRIDRCLSTLRLTGALSQLAGVVLGRFTKCEPGDGYGSLTLDEVFDDYFGPLNVPVYRGAAIGHIKRKLTVPVGAPAEMDADAGTLRLLQPAVT